jgi:hypothetical protein
MPHRPAPVRRAVLAAASDAFAASFANPPNTDRPRVWWHWLNGNITREGIEKETVLDAFDAHRRIQKKMDDPSTRAVH